MDSFSVNSMYANLPLMVGSLLVLAETQNMHATHPLNWMTVKMTKDIDSSSSSYLTCADIAILDIELDLLTMQSWVGTTDEQSCLIRKRFASWTRRWDCLFTLLALHFSFSRFQSNVTQFLFVASSLSSLNPKRAQLSSSELVGPIKTWHWWATSLKSCNLSVALTHLHLLTINPALETLALSSNPRAKLSVTFH